MQDKPDIMDSLSHELIGRDAETLSLVREYLSREDLREIKRRLIGTGVIGGKSVGMLLAHSILRRDPTFEGNAELENHDAFYVGADVFSACMEQRGWPKLSRTQETAEGYFAAARELKTEMLRGGFPEKIKEQFRLMLEHFGQSPMIVRPSSLREDVFENASAGKFASHFCPNQGSPEKRYQNFETAVRKIFASTLSEAAVADRLQRGASLRDEPLALLVQKVSGSRRGDYFFPDLSGIGLSHNPFVWRRGTDPKAGLLRLVFGLGTRAVNRPENEYARIAALDAPLLNPYNRPEDVKRFSQSNVDVLDLRDNAFRTISAAELLAGAWSTETPLDLIATRDRTASEYLASRGSPANDAWILTFDKLFESTPFAKTMSRMLKNLEQAYAVPVELEFTANFTDQEIPKLSLLRCRPFRTKGHCRPAELPEKNDQPTILLQQEGNFMGGSLCQTIARIIYVDPRGYAESTVSEKYEIARLTGRLNQQIEKGDQPPTLLLGPGRWGTTTPELGVPVRFSEINRMTAIGEIAYRDGSKTLELSFGAHFFQDLVERDRFYLAIYPEKEGVIFNAPWLKKQPNLLTALLPNETRLAKVVQVVDTRKMDLRLISDIATQQLICVSRR
ncbi:MAG: phosphoenolpyruvate synthase [Deltaproteobacteria bacterium]|nr:phosphoenolpyruvate synthase [Deltaproteobacteria bacterium]